MPDEARLSLGVWGWISTGQPVYDAGYAAASTEDAHVRIPGKSGTGYGASASLPAGEHNSIRITYFETKSTGSFIAPNNLNLWSVPFTQGDAVSTYYHLRGGKLSYEFVSWPFPIGSRHFRFKTLYQVQYAKIDSNFTAPLSTTATIPAAGSKTIILPSLGVGVTDYLSRYIHVDANASGFMIPHHGALGDADASISFRFSKLELQLGGRLYYFKTSTSSDYYMKGTLAGPIVGLKYYLN